MRHALLSLWCG